MADNTNRVTITLEVKEDGSIQVVGQKAKGAVDDLNQSAKESKGPLADLHSGWVLATGKIAAATAAFYVAKRAIYDTAKDIATQTMEIEKQARLWGVSTDELQKWQYAAKMADVDVAEMGFGIRLLSRNLEEASHGAGTAVNYFNAMGISVKDSSGNLRPLNDVMLDIMDKFASWEDGPRKIAIALALFGRGGEAMVPILNKGRSGFQELSKEAERLGIVLSPELVRKGSEAEEVFNKLQATIKANKLALAPYALSIAESIMAIVKAIDELKKRAAQGPFAPVPPGGEIRGSGGWVFRKGAYSPELGYGISGQKLEDNWQNAFPERTQPPIVPAEDIEKFKGTLLAEYYKTLGFEVKAIEIQRKMAIDEATKKGLPTGPVEQTFGAMLSEARIKEGLERGRSGIYTYEQIAQAEAALTSLRNEQEKLNPELLAQSKVEEAGLLGNINLIQQANAEAFKAKLDNLRIQGLLTPEIKKQLEVTNALSEKEKERAYWAELLSTKYPTYEAPPTDWESAATMVVKTHAESVSKLNLDLMTLTGSYGQLKQAEIDNLEATKQKILADDKLTNTEKQLNKQIIERKQAEAEARKNMDVGALINMGAINGQVQANTQLADQFYNLLPNSVNIFTDSIKNCGNTFKGFFQNLETGFLKLVQDIMFAIMKMEILNSLGSSGSSGVGGSGILGWLFGSGGGGGGGVSFGGTSPGWGGYAAGGWNVPGIYAEGTNFVPQNQFAFLHKGEAVVPAAYNQRDGDKGGGGGVVIVNQTTHYHSWYLQDGQTARDFIRRNKDAHLEIIKADADSANGVMRRIIKRLR